MAKGQEESASALSLRNSSALVLPCYTVYPLFYQINVKICNLFKIPSKLSAGPVYIPPHLPAEGNVHSPILQFFLERPDCLPIRRYKVPLLHRIDRYQIHMGMKPLCKPRQPSGIFLRIIDAARKGIFKGDAPSCLLKIISASVHQLRNSVPLRYGHQSPSFFIGHTVKR